MKIVAQKPFYSKVKKEKVHQDLVNVIPTYDSLPKDKQDFLIKLWLKNYDYGIKIVKNDAFTNINLVTCQDLNERFLNYPDVKANNLNFIKQVAEENGKAVDSILSKSANQDDFVYDTYESNYIDKSLDILKTVTVPKGFEKIDISLVGQDAYADGAMTKIAFLAKESLKDIAANKIKDM